MQAQRITTKLDKQNATKKKTTDKPDITTKEREKEMFTYETALDVINKSRNKVSKKVQNNTTLHKVIAVDGAVSVQVKLHNTVVVVMHPTHSVLFSGGWKTSTTKSRINDYSICSIYQKDFDWYVKDGTPFQEGIVVNRAGAVLSCTPQSLECASLSMYFI